MIAALDLVVRSRNDPQLAHTAEQTSFVSFGQPRVGNQAFARSIFLCRALSLSHSQCVSRHLSLTLSHYSTFILARSFLTFTCRLFDSTMNRAQCLRIVYRGGHTAHSQCASYIWGFTLSLCLSHCVLVSLSLCLSLCVSHTACLCLDHCVCVTLCLSLRRGFHRGRPKVYSNVQARRGGSGSVLRR